MSEHVDDDKQYVRVVLEVDNLEYEIKEGDMVIMIHKDDIEAFKNLPYQTQCEIIIENGELETDEEELVLKGVITNEISYEEVSFKDMVANDQELTDEEQAILDGALDSLNISKDAFTQAVVLAETVEARMHELLQEAYLEELEGQLDKIRELGLTVPKAGDTDAWMAMPSDERNIVLDQLEAMEDEGDEQYLERMQQFNNINIPENEAFDFSAFFEDDVLEETETINKEREEGESEDGGV